MSKMRLLMLLIIIIAVVCFFGCERGNVTEPSEIPTEAPAETQVKMETIGYQLPDYTEEEIQAAMDAVRAKFDNDFEGCRLLRLEYIEEKYPSDYEDFAKRYDIDMVIVLESDFHAGPDAPASLNHDHTYHNWKWILTDEGSGWTVRSSGYG